MERTRTAKAFLWDILVVISCICSCTVSFYATDSGYKLIWLLPLAYAICYFLFLSTVIRRGFSVFTATLFVMTYVRYVLLPIGIVLSGKYSGKAAVDPSDASLNVAIGLMVYELVAVSLFLLYHVRKHGYIKDYKQVEYQYDYVNRSELIIYVLFGGLTLGLVVLNPHTIENFNFIVPTELATKNMQNIGTIEQIATMCLSFMKQIILLKIAISCYRKYKISGSIIYKIVALMVMILNACIYTGTNRSDFILMTVASLLFYITLFPSMKKMASVLVVLLLLTAIPALSAYRKAGIVDTSSFETFISSFTDIMWGYSGGPYNVAIAYEAADMYPEGRNLLNLAYDFLRPTFGINLIMQKIPLTYSNVYFNYRYYMTEKVTQILPMVGEGYFYFGMIGCPLITMFFGWLGIKLSSIRKYTSDPMIFYFLTITCCRLGFIMGQNATIQMNDLSFNLFVPLLLIYFSKRVTISGK